MNLTSKVALITGAGSGIGQAIALSLARRGCHLALVDINPRTLEQTHQQVQALGRRVTSYPLDVTSREGVNTLPAQVISDHGCLDLLVNNAGVAVGGTFGQVSEVDFDWVMDVNFLAVVRMTRAFLPYLHQRDEARLVYLSSIFGIVSPPEQSAYSASKFAVRGFANALRHELENTPIGVTVVHPGGVATAIARNARVPSGTSLEIIRQKQALQEKMLRLPPEQAGEIIVKGIEQGRARVMVGTDARAIAWLERIMPVGYWQAMKKFLR
ncbi:SDR family NAD(P)-dependent oxidoreductase [Spirosoma spitsbergense]|uniref:SDR family NAD(P)-dependent oxidoreductase n=1 Tax=Spirosoma spitsbergense TaxID=431554 RepID=UPI00037398A7|nr:SDR family oxidoreductase [Spirosoma spitsbergense]